ncbi:MAG: hypothetical protein CL834_07215 [Crocinitomicaceae bacterium]|jgi:hypothetical protein|nr:hypothetical protein [Crocinitomicaceae bacterium]
MRFSGLAFSMAGSIGICVWIGRKWDERSSQSAPIGTLVGGVFGTVLAIWGAVKELSK